MNKEVIEALTYWLDECPGDVRPSGLLNDLKAARTALQHFKSWTSWIAVGERLPEGGRQVLARNSAGYMACVTTIYLNEMDGRFDGEDETPEDTTEPIGDITHWMPLPEPPKPGDVLPDGALVTMPDGERMYALGPCGDDDTDDDEPLPTGGECG